MEKLKIYYGPPCSGKSTKVQKILTDNDLVFDWDLLNQAITNLEYHDQSKGTLSLISGFRKIFINESQQNEVIDNFYLLTSKFTPGLERQLEGSDYEIIEIKATKEECLNRLENDDSRPNKEIFKKRIDEWFDNEQNKGVRMMEKEIRSMAENIEFRSNEETEEQYIEGYALKFGTWSENLGGFKETIERSALKNTDLSDVRALFNHDPAQVLARSSAGSLELDVDDIGLKFRARIPNTSYGKDLIENLRNGNVNQCSFGFMLDDNGDEMDYDKDEGIYKRTLRSIKEILDVSVVTYPAYRDTNVAPALRSIDKIEKEQQEKRQLEMEKLKLELELL